MGERYFDDIFKGNYIYTIGIDFRQQLRDIDNCTVKLQMWDTAGQERCRPLIHSYYRGVRAVAVVYDTTCRESFEHVQNWLNEASRYANHDVVKMIIGSKTDVVSGRQVSTEEGFQLAEKLGGASG